MEVRKKRPWRRAASQVSANKIRAQNKKMSNAIRICTSSEDQSARSQLRSAGPGNTKALGSALGIHRPKTTAWTRPQKAPGADKTHSESFFLSFFPAGGFFFRSLRVQTYSIEGNKAVLMQRESTESGSAHTLRYENKVRR